MCIIDIAGELPGKQRYTGTEFLTADPMQLAVLQ